MIREEVLNKVLKSYEAYFDIEEVEAKTLPLPLVAICSFFSHAEKYVLSRKANLWTADCHEYVYIFSMETLTNRLYEECRDYAYEQGMKKIEPGPGHMYSYITVLFICDNSEADAVKALKKCRIYKNFRFLLWGWMEYHTALIDLQADKVYTNQSGHSNAKILKRIIHVKNKRRI